MRWPSVLVVSVAIGGLSAFVADAFSSSRTGQQLRPGNRLGFSVRASFTCLNLNKPVQRLDGATMEPLNMSETAVCESSTLSESSVSESSNMSETSDEQKEMETLRKKDPLGFLIKEIQVMDVNAIINTGVLLLVTVVVLSKLATVDTGITRGWTAAEVAARIPIDDWLSYSEVLEAAPISTKAVTSATVYTIGDLIAQRTEGAGMGELDRGRTLRSLLAGLIGHGPLSHVWYDWSEGLFNDVLGWTAWWSFFPKVILDQATWGPFWNNVYITLLGIMKLEKPEVIWGDIKRTTIPLVVSGLKLWPLAHCITYGLIPVENRLLWVDLVEIVWVTILATQAASGGAGHGANAPEPAPVTDGGETGHNR